MRIVSRTIKRYRIPLFAALAVVAVGAVAAVQALEETRTIHIFPTTATTTGFAGGSSMLEQSLSGAAIIEDFTPENSAYVRRGTWRVVDTRPSVEGRTGTAQPAVESDEQLPVSTQGVQDTDEQAAAVKSSVDEGADVVPITDGDVDRIPDTEPLPDVSMGGWLEDTLLGAVARAQQGTGEGVEGAVAESAAQGTGNGEQETAGVEQVSGSVEEEAEAQDANDTEVEIDAVEEPELPEVGDGVSTVESAGNPEAEEDVRTVRDERDASLEDNVREVPGAAHLETAAVGDALQGERDVSGQAAEERDSGVAAGESGEEESDVLELVEGDRGVVEGAREEVGAPVVDVAGRAGGGGSWGEEALTRVGAAAEDEDVTICSVLDGECYLAEVSGFGLGWDLTEFEPKGFDLKLSLAAQVEARPGEEDSLYIRYFDGYSWHIADVVHLRGELSNYTNNGHFTFPLPEITSWNRLENLRVQVEYVHGGSSGAHVYLESVWIDARYEAPAGDELPELPQLYDELQALEDSAQPDILVLDGERIEFEHTDENRKEDLIIKSDRRVYEGLTRTTVYFNVTNESSRTEEVRLLAHFPESRGEVRSLKQYTENIPIVYEDPIYQPMAQTCAATWEWDADANGQRDTNGFEIDGDADTSGGVVPLDTVLVPGGIEQVSGQEPDSAIREVGAVRDEADTQPSARADRGRVSDIDIDVDAAETGAADVQQAGGEESSAVEAGQGVPSETPELEAAPETGDEREQGAVQPKPLSDVRPGMWLRDLLFGGRVAAQTDTSEPDVLVRETSTVNDTPQDDSLEVETDMVSGDTQNEVEDVSEAEVVDSPANDDGGVVPAADAVSDVDTNDGVEDPEQGNVYRPNMLAPRSALEAVPVTDEADTAAAAPAGYYRCADARPAGEEPQVLQCDSLNADKTNCIQNEALVGTQPRTEYVDRFLPVGVADGELSVREGLGTKAARFLGMRHDRKPVPRDFVVKDSSADLHTIEPGQTLYFEMEIEYPAKSRGEFWIEALGSRGGYGLLDPWWNSGWIYRTPITIDNTANATSTEQQVYVEIDSTLSDFWSHVQDDGDDIRFLRQVEGFAESEWYIDTSFVHRVPITVATSSLAGDLTSFPVYVNLADLGEDFWNFVKEDGGDIRVTAGNGTSELPRELVSIATTTQTGELHFQANTLSTTTENTFYIYFGSSTASDYAETDIYGARNVWSNGYVLVEHMDDLTTSSVDNSAAASPDGAKRSPSNPAESGSGKLGEAQSFVNANDDYIGHEASNLLAGETTYTISMWFNANTLSGGKGDTDTYGFSLYGISPTASPYNWLTVLGSELRLRAYTTAPNPTNRDTSGANITTGSWFHTSVAATQSSTATVRVNGVERLNTTSGSEPIGSNFTIGALRPTRNNTNIGWDGLIDEMRVSNVIRSVAWQDAEYANMATTTDFYATSSMETFQPSVTEELDYWTQHFSSTTQEARVWVQVDELAAYASTTIYMYYGNVGAGNASDAYAPFTYSTTTDLYYVLRDDSSSNEALLLYSYTDGTVVQFSNHAATSSLDRGQSTTTSSFDEDTIVRSNAPLMAKITSTGENWDSMTPQGFASTLFALGPRDANLTWHVGSPFGNASTTMFGSAITNVTIATGTTQTTARNVTSGSAGILESDIPVVVATEGGNADGLTPVPATTEDTYGIVSNGQSSNGPYVGITTNGTTMSVSCSASASTTSGSLSRLNRYEPTNCAHGNDGTGEAVRFYNISDPIGGSQNADGDGSEASFYWPFREFATEYFIPVNASYIAIACAPEVGEVNISIFDGSDVEQVSGTCTPGSVDGPGKLYFGADTGNNYLAGYYIASTDVPAKPFYAYYEDFGAGEDENNFLGAVQGRKYGDRALAYTFGAEELSTEPVYTQSNFRFYANEDAEPPTDPWPVGGENVAEDEEVTATYATDDGDVVRIRMGVEVSNVPVAIDENNFKLQYAEAVTCDAGGLTWSDVGPIGAGGTPWRGYNNGSLTDGDTLSTTTLSTATVRGTYEAVNASALFPNAIGVGEIVEHDWVVENNGANTNSSYCFRTVLSDGTTLAAYDTYPRIETNSAPEEPLPDSPFDNAKVFDLTPDLRFAATDIASDDIHYQVQIATTSDFADPVVDYYSGDEVEEGAFKNVTNVNDKPAFTSGTVVQFTVPTSLQNGVTYYWRVRGIDTEGSNEWGTWMNPASSFTTDSSLSVSTWFQTTEEQFSTNLFTGGAFASTSDDVRLGGPVGEYGTVTVTDDGWELVSTQREYADMIVVASPRYAGETVPQRTVRVRNKGTDSFEVRVDTPTVNGPLSGNTTVDYLVMDAGTYTIADGASGRTVVADTVEVSGQIGTGGSCDAGTGTAVSWTLPSDPAVLHTVTSVNDPQWVASNIYGSAAATPPSTTGGIIHLQTSFTGCGHTEAEDVDYVAIETFNGTTTEGVQMQATRGLGTFPRVNSTDEITSFSPPFLSGAPQTLIVGQITHAGGQGAVALVDTTGSIAASGFVGSSDEIGPNADRSGNDESGGVWAFQNASGTIEALFTGSMTTTGVDFDDAEIGNRWGSVSWTDSTPASTDILYQVEYEVGGDWQLVPDSEIPGNSVGTSTGPIDLSGLNTADYNVLRVVASLSSPTLTDTPVLSDITISWQQSVFTPEHDAPFDNELVGTTTPELVFSASDPQGEALTYEIQWSTDPTFTVASSAISTTPAGWRNIDDAPDLSPFNSGDTIGYTFQTPLTVGETYWWRIRAIDTGTSGYSFWSDPWSFTATTSVPVSTWFQTTKAQFDNDTKNGVETVLPGSVTPSGTIGEYGTIDVGVKTWTEVTLTQEFSNPVVVASVEYDSSSNSSVNQRRDVRVRNKEGGSFEVKVYDYDEAGDVTDYTGTTTVDWLVVEAGDWNIEAGAGSARLVAGTENVSTVLCSTYSGGGQAVTFSPAFTFAPTVLATVVTDNDSNWAHAGVDDAVDSSDTNEPTTTTAGLFLGRSHANCSHGPEDIDYVAMDIIHSTNNTVAFEAATSPDTIVGSPDAGGTAVTYSTPFSVTPSITIVQQLGEDGGQGGYAHVHTGGTNNATTLSLALEEDGSNADRGHTNEVVAYLAFASSSGTILRVPEALSGSIESQPITFSDGTGPKWGEITWTDSTPGSSTSTFQVLYATSGSYVLIPDFALPGNSTGTSTAPIDLGSLDINTYSELKIRNTLECTAAGTCPSLLDWTVSWSEGIDVSGEAYAYDETTPLSSGTVRIALNGVLQATTGSISGGTWTIPNVNAFPDDILTVWLDGAATSSRAVAVTKYDGTNDVTGMILYERHLTLGSDEDPTITNNDLSQYDYSVSGDTADLIHDVSVGNDLTVCVTGSGCYDGVLYVQSGTTYRPDSGSSGNVTTHDVRVNGTLRADGNTLYVSGSWDNNSAFVADTSTLIFTATSTSELIDSTGAATSSFFNVTLGQTNGSATWTPATALDVNGAFSVNYGTYNASTSPLSIAGSLSIGASGMWRKGTATTTLDGTGLANITDSTAGQDLGKLHSNGTTKTVRLQSAVVLTDLTIALGNTFDVTANNRAIELRGDFRNSGNFVAQSGTVTFTATTSDRVIIPGPSSFHHMTFNGVGGYWGFPSGDITANGNVTISAGQVSGPPYGTFSIGGSFDASSGAFAHNFSTLRFTSTTAGKTITPGGNLLWNVTFFGSGGAWSFGQANATTSNNFKILAGSVTLPSNKLYVAGDFQNEAGSFDANGGLVELNTVGTQKLLELSGSTLHDVRFSGASAGAGDWYSTAWPYRFGIEIRASEVDENLTDFPVYVDLGSAPQSMWDNAREDGGDIRVADENGDEVPIELVSYATTTQSGELHFRASALSDTSTTTYYIYYGNAVESGYAENAEFGAENVWTNGYIAVYHFEEEVSGTGNAAAYKDATGSGYDADDYLATSRATGQLGGAADLTPSSATDYVLLPNAVLNSRSDVTTSYWLQVPQSVTDTTQMAVVSGKNGSNDNEYLLFHSNHATYNYYTGESTGGNVAFGITDISDDTWRYFVHERNQTAGNTRLYVNGDPDNQNPISTTFNTLLITAGLALGQEHDAGAGNGFSAAQDLEGYLDEVRFATTTRTAGWISTEHNNQSAPESFYATTSVETVAARSFVDTNAAITGAVTIVGGLVTFPNGTLTLEGSLNNSGGIFDANDGEVLFATSSVGHQVAVGGSEFYDVTFNNAAGGWQITEDATSTNNWTLTAAAIFDTQSGVRVGVEGTFANAIPGATDWTGSTLALYGGGSYTVGDRWQAAESYDALEVGPDTDVRLWQSDATSYAVDATGSLYSQDHANNDGDLYIWGSYERTSGTDYWSYATDFEGTALGGGVRAVDVRFADGASATFAGATLAMLGAGGTTTVRNQGSGTYDLVFDGGTINAQYYSITDTDIDGLSLLGSTTVTSLADGAFTLSTEGGSMLTVASTTIDENPALQIERVVFSTSTGIASGFNVTASGTPSSYWWFRNHMGNFDGEEHDNNDGDPGNIRWDDSGFFINVSGTVYSGEGVGVGSVCAGAAQTVTLAVNGSIASTTACSNLDGTYFFENVPFSGDPSIIVYLATSSTAQAATITRTPTGDITGLDVYENHVIVRHEDASPMTIDYLAAFDADDDSFIPFSASSTAGTLAVNADTALLVWAGDEFAPNGDVTLNSGSGTSYDGSLVLQSGSTFTATGAETHTIGGSWDAASDATFTASNSTVVFTATTSGKTIESYSPFYALTLNGAAGEWDVASALTVSDDLTVTAGTLTGANDIMVENGMVTGDGTISMTGGTFMVETGGNFGGDTDWTFDVLTFGDGVGGSTTKIGSGSITTGGTLGIATGHTLNAGSSEWVLLGSPAAFSVAGTFNADTSTTTYATSSAMTISALSYYNLVLAPAAGGSPIYTFVSGPTNAENIYMGDGTNPVTVTAHSNNPLITVAGDVTILPNATYESAGSNDIRIGGSYTNSGTYNDNGGGVLFNSSDVGETITTGGSVFGAVAFNGAGGGWTLLDGATTTGNLSLVAGAALTLPVGEFLEVQGIFSNSIPAATTWNGTLYLNSGTDYPVNSKTDAREEYGTLAVGANTHIRMWNSTSSAYTVDPTGSLYSMDHDEQDGDLYIWGHYERTSGADYWSYDTDFDGVDLATTSSERPVSVFLADNATTTLSGGAFEILGAPGATTSIAAQGGGTYALEVAGGTFGAQYYRIRDINSTGLSLSGVPTVTQLGNADLLLEEQGGSMLTVAGTVLDQNGVKTWANMLFATSSGISSGFNVTSVGSAGVSWRFIPGTGNYYGEAFDNDSAPDPNPGYLIFSDSDDEITINGFVYSDEGSTVSPYCAGSSQVVALIIEGESVQTTTCDESSGAYSFPSVSGYEPGDTVVVYITGTSTQAANVTQDLLAGVQLDLYEHRVIVRHEDVDPMTIEGMAAWDSGEDSDIPYTASTSSSPHSLTLPANTKLIVWNNKEFVPGGDVTLNSGSGTSFDGTLELRTNATYESSASVREDITIGGSWLTGSGATFVAGTSSVTFVGTSSNMHVSPDVSSFNTLTFDGVGGTWTFDDTAATTTGDFTITNGTVNVASSTLAVGGSFVNSGSMNAASTSITFSSAGAETVTFNGDEVGSVTFTGAGTFTMTDINATSTGSVRIQAGTVALPTGTFAVRHAFENTGGSFTQSQGTLRLYGDTAAQNLQFNGSTVHNLAVVGSGSWTFVDTAATTTGSTTISVGGLTAPALSFAIGGSLVNAGTYNPNGGATYFFATSTGKVVDAGGSVFGDVTFSGIGGGWTVATSATSTGDWRIKAGAAFVMASSTRLEVQGVFENQIGGSGTDWTDSVLYLNASGTSYTVNGKGVDGDQYATLIVGDHTDVKLWNSAAATTTVAASSSLYSMDHADQGGDLYIWGEYVRSSGADYWSYDRDFDGSPLTGGNRRPVDVRIASSSYVTVTGGTLAIDGDAGATTTIDVLGGTGTYDLSFSGSSLTLSYFSLRGLNAAGFRITGSPSIAAFNNADFELDIDDGVILDIASSVIDQNPTQTYPNMYFASTSGVATGTNVKVTGATTNYWRLLPTFGTFDGEYHDDDGIDACGAIRWGDSTCLEVSQAHYRFRADDGGEGAPDNEWYDQDWGYRKQITVSNPNASALSDYPVRMEIAAELGDMESDYRDLVFTDSTGTTTIPFYIEEYTSATATVWAKVPQVAGNDVAYIYMYYKNQYAVDAQSGSDTFIAFDDFEHDNLASLYVGNIPDFDTGESLYWQKLTGLTAATGRTSTTTNPGIYRTDVDIEPGTTIEFYQRVQSGVDDEPCTYFGVQGVAQNYAVCLDQYPSDKVVLVKDVTSRDVTGSALASSPISYTVGTYWYRVRVDWLLDDSINVYVYDYADALLASVSDSDSEYSDGGGFGFGFWGQTQGWDFYTVRPYAASEPTYMIGSAQQGGGASWKAAQDTPISQDSNTPFRVRFSVENSGPLQESQSYQLEYASMDGYGSCSAVVTGEYDTVPNDAGCGVEALCMTASPNFDDGDGTSQLLNSASGLAYQSGYLVEDPSNDTPSNDLATSTLTEVEYAIELTSFATDSDYCLRVTDGGDDLDSYGQVAKVSVNGVPVITAWQLNAEQPIILTEGVTTAITATGSASDVNGDLLYASTTIYRSGVGPDCAANDNNCYKLICTPACGINECEYTCTANIHYFADPTDGDNPLTGETWDAEFFVRDVSGNVATATAYNVELWSMNAVAVTSGNINYGTLELQADTGLDPKESELQNTGNTAIDVQVQGTPLTAGASSIEVSNQLYATESFEYSTSSCLICTALTGSASPVELDLPKPTSTTPVKDSLYWGIYIPVGTEAVPHQGYNTFIAISD